MTDAARRRRTRWFTRSELPVHLGEYECAVRITSAQRSLILWRLNWDGKGFIVPFPMIVHQWRGLVKKPAAKWEAKNEAHEDALIVGDMARAVSLMQRLGA